MTAPTALPALDEAADLADLATAVAALPRPTGRPLVVATDGSRVPTDHGAVGGWAFAHATAAGQVRQHADEVAVDADDPARVTSSRMELRAVLEALRATREQPWVQLLVDCQPTVTVLRRLEAYLRRGLTSRAGQPLADADLLVAIAREMAATPHRAVHVTWVKAHARTQLNQVADRAARACARRRARQHCTAAA